VYGLFWRWYGAGSATSPTGSERTTDLCRQPPERAEKISQPALSVMPFVRKKTRVVRTEHTTLISALGAHPRARGRLKLWLTGIPAKPPPRMPRQRLSDASPSASRLSTLVATSTHCHEGLAGRTPREVLDQQRIRAQRTLQACATLIKNFPRMSLYVLIMAAQDRSLPSPHASTLSLATTTTPSSRLQSWFSKTTHTSLPWAPSLLCWRPSTMEQVCLL
jgi:hypothetical protein